MKHKVRLTKIKSTHSNLRTDIIEGETDELPEVGKHFLLLGVSLTQGMDTRMVTTTKIQTVNIVNSEYEFTTLNSTYKLEVLK